MVLSFLIGRSLFHLVLVIGFGFLFSKWSISSSPSSYLTQSQSRCYSIFILIDYVIWGTSSLWAKYIPIQLETDLSSGSYITSKFLSILAYACLHMIPEEKEGDISRAVKNKNQMRHENRLRVMKTFFYHFVNSPVGMFIQNGLVIAWVFIYPSVFSVLLLLVSTLNVVNVKSEKIDEYIILSPRVWSQNLLVGYAIFMCVVYYAMTSGLSSLFEEYSQVYYLLLGGLTSFKAVNWFTFVCLFYLGWYATVRFLYRSYT